MNSVNKSQEKLGVFTAINSIQFPIICSYGVAEDYGNEYACLFWPLSAYSGHVTDPLATGGSKFQ